MGQILRNVGPCSDLGLKCLKLGDCILATKGTLEKFTYTIMSTLIFLTNYSHFALNVTRYVIIL